MQNLSNLLDRQLFNLGGTPVTIGSVATAALIILFAYWMSRALQQALARAFRSRGVDEEGTVSAMRRLLHYAVMLVGIGVALDTLGINLSALFAAGAVFAVGIGFAMQNIAQNFVSGVILLAERSIKPGDVLEVDGAVVRVTQLGIRATLVRSRNDEDVIVPNSVLVQSAVKNYTLRDSLYRVRATVGVVYRSDMDLVTQTLLSCAEQLPWRVADRDPAILLLRFGDSSVDFEASVWINDPWNARAALSKLNDAIWLSLKQAGVTIAFPQLDVHFDPVVEDSMTALSGSRAA
jgi:small-conductance mechanosensitive channel